MSFDPNITNKHQLEVSSDEFPQHKKQRKELKTSVNIPLAASDAFDSLRLSQENRAGSTSDVDSEATYTQLNHDPLERLIITALFLSLDDE